MSTVPVRKEVQEFQFKLLSQLRLFSSEFSIKLDKPSSLIATASKYGLIFVGTPIGITCIQTNTIVAIQNQRTNNRGYITSFPRRDLKLGVLPSHIAINCDNELLAAAVIVDGCPLLLIYSVTAFGALKIKTRCEVRMSSTPGVIVTDLQWNPGAPNVIGSVLSDGSAFVYEFKDTLPTISSIPPNSQASCLCWSPKGKQIVIGAKNGSLTQYKPDLKAVKTFAPPQIYNQPMVVSVHWLSNYQFIAAYKDRIDNSSKPAVVIVNVPKSASQNFVNYEDICFGFGTNRPEHYFIHQQLWNVIILGTSNGTEVVVLGQNGDSWEQWLQDESNRAQLPVSLDYQDVYLTGMAIDYSSVAPIPIGENNVINPMPLLIMYSQEGVLCLFHVINMFPGVPAICHAPQPLPDQTGMHLFSEVQIGPSGDNKLVNDVQVIDCSEINRSIDKDQVKQGAQFKLGSVGSDLSSPIKESLSSTLPSHSPFAGLNMQKQNTALTANTSLGNVSAISGFGMLMDNSSTPSTLTSTPKFSTSSSTLSSQQPPNSSTLSFQLATTPQKATAQTNMSLQIQQPPNSKGLSTFQFPNTVNSIAPQFPMTSSTETAAVNQEHVKPALLMTPLSQTNNTSITTQGIPSSKPSSEKTILNKEVLPKSESTIKAESTPQTKEGEASQLNQAQKLDEEKEQSVIEVDFIGAIKEEVSALNLEVSNLQKLKSSLNFSVGHEQINDLVGKINDLKVFEKDVKETTVAQEAEVSALVNSVVEMFSWLENVKTKQKQINNPKYMDLMESQDLDPVTKKHINNIEQYIYYLDTQIKQANIQLDALWAQHKGKPLKSLELPNMEAIYQTIVAENYILAAQKVRVTELEVRLKEKLKTTSRKIPQISDFSSSSLKSNSDTELDELADKLLMSKLGQNDDAQANSLKDTAEKYIFMSNTQKYLSSKKEHLLHKWHKNHIVINAKSPKRPSGQIDLSKFSKQVKTPSSAISTAQNINISTQTTTAPAKSIFTITSQAPFSSERETVSEKIANVKETKNTSVVTLPSSFSPKIEQTSNQVKQLPSTLLKHETPSKGLNDSEIKQSGNSNQLPFGANLGQSTSAFSTGAISDSTNYPQHVISPFVNESATKNSSGDSDIKTAVNSLNSSANSSNKEITSASPTTTFNFTYKTPTSSNTVVVATSSENLPVKFTTTATVAEVSAKSTLPITVTDSKETLKKDGDVATSDLRNATPETNKPVTTFALAPNLFSITSTVASNTLEKPATSANNIFSTTFTSGQNTSSTFNFSKNSVFSNVNTNSAVTSGLKTPLLFGTPSSNGNTTTAPTSIFGGKPVTSPSQFISPATTVSMISTTSNSPLASTVTTKPIIASTPSVATTTATFFTKPNALKSLFGNATMSVTGSSPLFKSTTSPLGTSIFASSQPQQVVTAPVSANAATTSSKLEIVTSSPTLPSTTTVAATTPAPTVTGTTISCVSSIPSVSLAFSPSLITSPESSVSSVVTSPSCVVSTAPAIAAPIIATNLSTPVNENESTPVSTPVVTTSFGITPSSSSVFGAKTTPQTLSGFDATVSSPAATTKTFGNTVTSVGFAAATTTESTSLFGNTVSKSSIFGNQGPSSPSFGSNPVTTASSMFSTTAVSVFGSPTTKTTTASMFGTPATFGTSTTHASVFGAAAALSSTSFFGSPTTTSAFGTPSAPSPFSSPSATNATSFFGQAICSPTSSVTNAFSSISFGQKPAAVTTTGSIFGGNRTFETKPLFGQSGGLFGQATSSPGTFGSSGGSLFGNASTFGSPQPQTALFQTPAGPSGGSLFNSGSPSGGSFSAGNQSVAQSGFGTPPNFQSAAKPFGAGSSPVFGGQTSFGASPTFGGSATFGSPNKVFGSPAAASGPFGSPTQQSSTFENLAGQNTLTFGNLAQGQPNFNSNQPFGVGSPQQQNTFPNTSSFGGSSFSTWR